MLIDDNKQVVANFVEVCQNRHDLAAADETLLTKSIASFREEMQRAIVLGIDYVVLHPGSARGSCEADGIETCARIQCEYMGTSFLPRRSGGRIETRSLSIIELCSLGFLPR